MTDRPMLILASGSPRRRELLAEAGIPFAVHPSDADETLDPALSPEGNALALAFKKADAVAHRFPDDVTLAADTMVVLGDDIIGKPVDEADARSMLARLSGETHVVVTGVALVRPADRLRWSGAAVSRVTFRPVAAAAIAAYVATGEPMDKAGGYAIQGGAAGWIERFEGSRTNIIGLPMELVADALSRFGVGCGGAPCR